MRRSREAFTLIELLIVIAIIGVLAAIMFNYLIAPNARARDQVRKSDLKNIQKALELYQQCQKVPSYPSSLPNIGSAWTEGGGAGATCTAGTSYINTVPEDPKNHESYGYTLVAPLQYTLCACIENANDSDLSTTPASVGTMCGTLDCGSGGFSKIYQLTVQ